MVKEAESINLLMAAGSIPALVLLYRHGVVARFRYFIAGFLAIVGATVFTVTEGFGLESISKTLEHLLLALSGFFFLFGVLRLPRDLERERRTP